jgi:hypothetical protein
MCARGHGIETRTWFLEVVVVVVVMVCACACGWGGGGVSEISNLERNESL